METKVHQMLGFQSNKYCFFWNQFNIWEIAPQISRITKSSPQRLKSPFGGRFRPRWRPLAYNNEALEKNAQKAKVILSGPLPLCSERSNFHSTKPLRKLFATAVFKHILHLKWKPDILFTKTTLESCRLWKHCLPELKKISSFAEYHFVCEVKRIGKTGDELSLHYY